MPPAAPSSILIHAARLTRLNPAGSVYDPTPAPVGGPKNSIVTTALTHLNWTTEVQAGDSRVVVGGSDCICVQYRGQDKLLRLGLELEMCRFESALMEMMLGAPIILGPVPGGGGTAPIIGTQFPATLRCGDRRQPVAIEAWSTAWNGDEPMVDGVTGDPVYIHWVFPKTFWQIGNGSIQNDFLLPTLTGYTEDNPAWGTGPYADTTVNPGPKAGWFLETLASLPASTDGDYATAA